MLQWRTWGPEALWSINVSTSRSRCRARTYVSSPTIPHWASAWALPVTREIHFGRAYVMWHQLWSLWPWWMVILKMWDVSSLWNRPSIGKEKPVDTPNHGRSSFVTETMSSQRLLLVSVKPKSGSGFEAESSHVSSAAAKLFSGWLHHGWWTEGQERSRQHLSQGFQCLSFQPHECTTYLFLIFYIKDRNIDVFFIGISGI